MLRCRGRRRLRQFTCSELMSCSLGVPNFTTFSNRWSSTPKSYFTTMSTLASRVFHSTASAFDLQSLAVLEEIAAPLAITPRRRRQPIFKEVCTSRISCGEVGAAVDRHVRHDRRGGGCLQLRRRRYKSDHRPRPDPGPCIRFRPKGLRTRLGLTPAFAARSGRRVDFSYHNLGLAAAARPPSALGAVVYEKAAGPPTRWP